MAPELFRLPLLPVPIRFFGLFVFAGFALAVVRLQRDLARPRGAGPAFGIAVAALVAVRGLALLPSGLSFELRLGAVLLADLAAAAALALAWRRGRSETERIEDVRVFLFAAGVLLAAWLGGRLLRVALGPGEGTGMASWGALAGGAVFALAARPLVRRPLLEVFDALAVAAPLGLFAARWGCFAAGCCFGRPTDVAWAITVPVHPACHTPVDLQGSTPLHPTQVYLSLFAVALFTALAALARRRPKPGTLFVIGVAAYVAGRIAIAPYRGD